LVAKTATSFQVVILFSPQPRVCKQDDSFSSFCVTCYSATTAWYLGQVANGFSQVGVKVLVSIILIGYRKADLGVLMPLWIARLA
jgi:hypothetical protein